MFEDDDFELPDDLAAMADAAGAALAGMGEEFAAGAEGDANTLKEFIGKAAQSADEEDFQQNMARAFGIAHDLKGQGATFGYNLVTEIAGQLCTLTRPQNNPTRESLPQMQTCAQALYDVLAGRIEGDGGTIGARLRLDLGIG
ncbi:MAG: Hpt domain-containing protein [Robiginitomaculum sp.]|nr:Hpt domain-containing protein [Robiginitomaculum sp.]MDQ7076960.1 Hpt domain-containing protein [Robiginitomaculum sp.]